MLDITESPAARTVSFLVRVQPRASKDEIAGLHDGAIKIRLTAPAIDNRANQALVEFLAAVLKTAKSAVRIQSGAQSRTKRVEIRGVTRQQILDLLEEQA